MYFLNFLSYCVPVVFTKCVFVCKTRVSFVHEAFLLNKYYAPNLIMMLIATVVCQSLRPSLSNFSLRIVPTIGWILESCSSIFSRGVIVFSENSTLTPLFFFTPSILLYLFSCLLYKVPHLNFNLKFFI